MDDESETVPSSVPEIRFVPETQETQGLPDGDQGLLVSSAGTNSATTMGEYYSDEDGLDDACGDGGSDDDVNGDPQSTEDNVAEGDDVDAERNEKESARNEAKAKSKDEGAGADEDGDKAGEVMVTPPQKVQSTWHKRLEGWGSREKYPRDAPNTSEETPSAKIMPDRQPRLIDGVPDFKRFRKNRVTKGSEKTK